MRSRLRKVVHDNDGTTLRVTDGDTLCPDGQAPERIVARLKSTDGTLKYVSLAHQVAAVEYLHAKSPEMIRCHSQIDASLVLTMPQRR